MQKRWWLGWMPTLVVWAFSSLASASIGIFDRTADWGGLTFPPKQGDYKASGTASYSDGIYSIQGNGDDIWGDNDEGFFLYTERSGSQSITGKVIWEDPNNQEWSKIGLMVREKGDDPRSRHYWCFLRGQAFGDRIETQWRGEYGGLSDNAEIHPPDDSTSYVPADSDAAIWFRVTRIAEVGLVISEWSYDGNVWTLGNVNEMAFPDTIAWGIAICNHNDNLETAKATVEGVKIDKPDIVIGKRLMEGTHYFDTTSFYREGDEFLVTIDLTCIEDHSMSVDIQETVPPGWSVSEIGQGGVESGGIITWSNYIANPGTSSIHYKVKVPVNPAGIAVWKGSTGILSITGQNWMSYPFSGVGLFDAHADMGQVEVVGSAEYDSGRDEYTLTGSGEDIWNQSDEFHFLFKEVSGPFLFKGHIELDPFESESEWVKVGLMVRDTLTDDSPYALIFNRPDFLYDVDWRPVAGERSNNIGLSEDNLGDFEIVRIGDTLYMNSISLETGEMITRASLQISLTDPVYIGLAVTSHEDGHLAGGYFSQVELQTFDGYGVRTLGTDGLPKGGGNVEGNSIAIFINSGVTSNREVIEELPDGFTVENIRVSNGFANSSENRITWTLADLSGVAEMTYDFVVPAERADTIQTFSGGDYAGLPFLGDREMYPIAFEIPFVDRSTSLDGTIEEGEYDGAYVELFDHADSDPPGVHLSGNQYSANEEQASLFIYHDRHTLYVAIHVKDGDVLDFSDVEEIENVDSVELCLDGNLGRSEILENNRFGFRAGVQGDGRFVAGSDAPTPELLSNGGYTGSHGLYWNYGAKVKNDREYVVEYQIALTQILSPIDRTIFGFNLLFNQADGFGINTGKWAYWDESQVSSINGADPYDNERNWAIVQLLSENSTLVSQWELF